MLKVKYSLIICKFHVNTVNWKVFVHALKACVSTKREENFEFQIKS
jgi:hypothetical protein